MESIILISRILYRSLPIVFLMIIADNVSGTQSPVWLNILLTFFITFVASFSIKKETIN